MSGANENEIKDYLGMSDDDFLNINAPDADADKTSQGVTSGSDANEDQNQDTAKGGDQAKDKGDEDTGTDKATDTAAAADDATKSDGDPAPGSTGADGAAINKAEDKTKPTEVASDKAEGDKKVEVAQVDHAAFYQQVMKPFKANGRTIELKTPEEAIRLMQMGAGYGRKLQDLQPALKTLKMLEKAELLDEGKLSFLIDINNKNPEAIKKLIKDSGIDPLDLNIGDNVDYSPKSHSVSDKEMAFHTATDDLQSQPGGMETLRVVNQTWDKESKAALWDQPQILGIIQVQRENGVYDQIAAEIDRQKLLGQIAPNTPFLQAYKTAGDHLQATNGFKVSDTKAQVQTPGDTPATVIATRTAAPKAQVQNSDKAAAASSTKTTPRKGGATINPLEMADDEFLKQFNGRL